MKELLKFKINRKKKKPNFVRSDANRYKRFKSWRKPRGMHNKLRRRVRGHVHVPKIGYGSPVLVRFLRKDGLIPLLINNINGLKNIDHTKNSVIIGKIGLKNKLEIIKKCIESKFVVVNIKNPDKYLEEQKKLIEEKKKLKAEKKTKKEKSKEALEKKAKEKEEKKEEPETKKKSTEELIKEDMKKSLPGDKK
ncbi:MAG: hypothetical protein KJ623_03790 [Nanoarchaeota archaeon]|nr:hypothetical protein [Nanoarchaeota archaeon]MBU0962696.1 hypothetical protein [Nanoarchaeota archaeon]